MYRSVFKRIQIRRESSWNLDVQINTYVYAKTFKLFFVIVCLWKMTSVDRPSHHINILSEKYQKEDTTLII